MTASNVQDACPALTLTTQTLRVVEESSYTCRALACKRVRAAAQSCSAAGTATGTAGIFGKPSRDYADASRRRGAAYTCRARAGQVRAVVQSCSATGAAQATVQAGARCDYVHRGEREPADPKTRRELSFDD